MSSSLSPEWVSAVRERRQDDYDWEVGDEGSLEVSHFGLSGLFLVGVLRARFLGWMAGSPVFGVVCVMGGQNIADFARRNGEALTVSFLGQSLPPYGVFLGSPSDLTRPVGGDGFEHVFVVYCALGEPSDVLDRVLS